MHQVENFEVPNILIIQLRQLGDVLLTTPAIKALRKKYPHAKISFLTEKASSPIVAENPYLNDVIIIDRKQRYFDQLKIIKDIRSRSFDIVVDFLANPRTAVITYFSGAALTIAHKVKFRGFFYKEQVEEKGDYVVNHKLSLLSVLGIQCDDVTPHLQVKPESDNKMKSFFHTNHISDDDFVVCIDLTHRRMTRKWPGERYAELADRLKKEYNAKVIFLWGPGEKDEVAQIMSLCGEKHVLDPGSNINELAALLKRCDLLIGNCSFPRHLAVSQKTPTLVILGSTSDAWTHPDAMHQTVATDLECQPCNNNRCNLGLKCLTDLSVNDVMERLDNMKPYLSKLARTG